MQKRDSINFPSKCATSDHHYTIALQLHEKRKKEEEEKGLESTLATKGTRINY